MIGRAPAARGLRAVLPALGVAALAVAVVAVLAVRDPRIAGSYGVCPSVALFGLACPGCGSLRAIGALTRGEVFEAWAYNPAALPALLTLGVMWLFWWRRLVTGTGARFVAPGWVLYLLAGLIVGYAVLRNVPALTPLLGPLGVP